MIPQIITLRKRDKTLFKEMERQGIKNYVLWEGDVFEPVSEAIASSHKKIVQWAKDKNLPEVLIMEDDVHFPHDKGFEYFLSKKPDDFDLYLSGIYDGEIKNGIVNRFCGLHCYIIHSRYYDKFLSTKTANGRHIDYAQSGRGKFIVCYPFAAIQHNGWSDNAKSNVDYTGLLVGRNIYGLTASLQ